MEGATIPIIIGLVGLVVLVILGIRVRAFESLVAGEMSLKVEATRRAIDSLQERLSPPTGIEETTGSRRKKRRTRRGRRKRS